MFNRKSIHEGGPTRKTNRKKRGGYRGPEGDRSSPSAAAGEKQLDSLSRSRYGKNGEQQRLSDNQRSKNQDLKEKLGKMRTPGDDESLHESPVTLDERFFCRKTVGKVTCTR